MAKRWSPVSTAGKVYEFNRGVICISKDDTKTGYLDQNGFHHDEATILLILSLLPLNKLNREEKETIARTLLSFVGKPFEAGVLAASLSNILIRLEGNEVVIFLPNIINEYQINELIEVIMPRKYFNFSIHYQNEIYGNISYQEMIYILSSKRKQIKETQSQLNPKIDSYKR